MAAAAKKQKENRQTILPTVIIVTMSACCSKDAWPEAESAIEREFATIGVKVIKAAGSATGLGEQLEELDTVSAGYKAAAAIRVVKVNADNAFAVRLWLKDRVTLKTTLRSLKIKKDNSADPALILGVRTVELFRASLNEIELATTGEHPVIPPEKIQKIVAATKKIHREPVIQMQLGLMGLIGGGIERIGPCGGIGGFMGVDIFKRVKITAEAAFFLWSNPFETPGFKSDFNYYKYDVEILATLFKHRKLRFMAGISAGVAVGRVKGIQSDMFNLNKEQSTAALLGGIVSVEYWFAKRVAVFTGFNVDYLFSTISILHGDAEAAVFGPVLFEGNAGIVFNLF